MEIRGGNTHTEIGSRPREHANAFGRHDLKLPVEVACKAYSERNKIGVDHERLPAAAGTAVA